MPSPTKNLLDFYLAEATKAIANLINQNFCNYSVQALHKSCI
ncbi:hypothetical protein [Chlorogloeopsis fritschii]|nr:hypothetical protein [Chlorogloeopsis fritschii]